MKLKLTRPLVFFDLETTGLDLAKDRIIELSYYKFYPNGSSESKTYRINPEQHISAESTQIHGITDDDVRDCPTFKQVAPEIVKAWEGCDGRAADGTEKGRAGRRTETAGSVR